MYLTDDEIIARLSEFEFDTPDPRWPFDAATQVQPCSIDLRVSTVFWKPKGRRRPIDLGRSRVLELQPRRYWKRYEVTVGEGITIKPGEIVLARVHERLRMPADCAGEVEGRSSFARMGLSVHATGSFINPGWDGHMPLTLINSGKAPITLPALLPVCQLRVVRLAKRPSRTYGHADLHSKYVNDDGGPSYWWRDKVTRELFSALGTRDLGADVQERILNRIGVPTDEVLARLEDFVAAQPASKWANADELLEAFAEEEDKQRMKERIVHYGCRSLLGILIGTTLGSFLERPFGTFHYVLWIVTALWTIPTYASIRTPLGEYIGVKELARIDHERKLANSPGT